MKDSERAIPGIDLVGIGASTIDLITVVDRFPEEGTVQQAESFAIAGGGPVATALCAAAKLGLQTAMVDSIGCDWAGERVLDEFSGFGVETAFVQVHGSGSTSMSNILVRRSDAERAIAFSPATCPPPQLSERCLRVIAEARFLHINGRHPEACRVAVATAKRNGTLVSFDGGAGRYREGIEEWLGADILIVAGEFARQATGLSSPAEAAAALVDNASTGVAIVTDGARGSWLAERGGGTNHQPAFLMDGGTIDTTGAGDAFHGAFLAAAANGSPPPEAQKFAAAAAALNTTALGGRAGLPRRAAVERLLGTA